MLSRRFLYSIIAAPAVVLAVTSSASAATVPLIPPKPFVLTGVSDRGTDEGVAAFEEFKGQVGKRPGLLESFQHWNNSLRRAYQRWVETKTRPILHIDNYDEKAKKFLTPKQIALGEGDGYLLRLNSFFASHKLPAYIRPLGEGNRCANDWSAVECKEGKPIKFKGGGYTTAWYRRAFQRISAILRGGVTLVQLNKTLAGLGLPPVKSSEGPLPVSLPRPPVIIVWSQLPIGSPPMRGNEPIDYWPGEKWVGLVGADYYSDQELKNLTSFFEKKYLRTKAFALTEWAVREKDKPKFIKDAIAWTLARPRVRMLSYYIGFNDPSTPNPYDLKRFPRTVEALRAGLHRSRFLGYIEPNAGTLPVFWP